MSGISPETVTDRRQGDHEELHLLDIRPSEAFEDWHIPGSENVPVGGHLKSNVSAAKSVFEELPADKEIVTVCAKGKLSQRATGVLREMGYDAKTLEGGLRGWSRVHRDAAFGLDIQGNLYQIARPGTGCLSYLLISEGEALVIDPSQYLAAYESRIEDAGAELTGVLETHAHADHVSGARRLAEQYDVPHYLHEADHGAIKNASGIGEDDEVTVGAVRVRVLHTPGHTPGSVTYAIDDVALLTGDTLFLESVGRPDLGSASGEELRERAETLHESLQRLREYPEDVIVGPGHDPGAPEPPVEATLATIAERNARFTADADSFVQAMTADPPAAPPNHDRIKRINTGHESVDADQARELELGPNRCAAE